MTRSYSRELPMPVWQLPLYIGRWHADQSRTPYIDDDTARDLILSQFIRPLEGNPSLVLPTLSKLLYGSVLAHILIGRGSADFQALYEKTVPLVDRFLMHVPSPITLSPQRDAPLQHLTALRTTTTARDAARRKMLTTVMEWTWRYKPAQVITLGQAALFGALMLAIVGAVPDQVLHILMQEAVQTVQLSLA